MANIDYTVDGVIADVKRMGSIPTHQSLFQEADFVATLSDEMKTILVPMIMSTMENHFQTYADQTIVAGTQNYTVPWRAIGNKLKAVKIHNDEEEIEDLPRLDLRDIGADTIGEIFKKSGFRLEGNDVILYPDDNWPDKTLRLYYFRRPNDLCTTDNAGQVVSINTSTLEVQLANLPTEWTTSDTIDAIKNEPPFKALGEAVVVTNIAGLVITLASIPTGLAVGDWIALKGQSPIPQIPYDCFPLLAARGVVAVFSALSPQAGAQAIKDYGELRMEYLKMIAPRVDDAPKKLVPRRGIWQARGGW